MIAVRSRKPAGSTSRSANENLPGSNRMPVESRSTNRHECKNFVTCSGITPLFITFNRLTVCTAKYDWSDRAFVYSANHTDKRVLIPSRIGGKLLCPQILRP